MASISLTPSSRHLENQVPATTTSAAGLLRGILVSVRMSYKLQRLRSSQAQPPLLLPRASISCHSCLSNCLQAHLCKGGLRPKPRLLQEEDKWLVDHHLGQQFTWVLAVTRLWWGIHEADTRAQPTSDEIRPQGTLNFLLLGAVLTLGGPVLFTCVSSDKHVRMRKRGPRPVWGGSWKNCAK